MMIVKTAVRVATDWTRQRALSVTISHSQSTAASTTENTK